MKIRCFPKSSDSGRKIEQLIGRPTWPMMETMVTLAISLASCDYGADARIKTTHMEQRVFFKKE